MVSFVMFDPLGPLRVTVPASRSVAAPPANVPDAELFTWYTVHAPMVVVVTEPDDDPELSSNPVCCVNAPLIEEAVMLPTPASVSALYTISKPPVVMVPP